MHAIIKPRSLQIEDLGIKVLSFSNGKFKSLKFLSNPLLDAAEYQELLLCYKSQALSSTDVLFNSSFSCLMSFFFFVNCVKLMRICFPVHTSFWFEESIWNFLVIKTEHDEYTSTLFLVCLKIVICEWENMNYGNNYGF